MGTTSPEISDSKVQLQNILRKRPAPADRLQYSFVPVDIPEIDNFTIETMYYAASEDALVGGDFYDVFALDKRRLGVVIADVAGKGIRSAVHTATAKYMLRAYALDNSCPVKVMQKLNDALDSCTPDDVFITLIYGVLDTSNCSLEYVNAGHEHPIFYSAFARSAVSLETTGQALCLGCNNRYKSRSVAFESGDCIVFYTDGVTDSGSGEKRMGEKGLKKVVEKYGAGPLNSLRESIVKTAWCYGGGHLSDDTSLLILRRR